MAWQLLGSGNIDELVSFLSTEEWRHVAFSSRLLVNRRPSYPNPYKTCIYVNRSADENGIREAMLLTRSGLVLPVLSNNELSTRRDDILPLIKSKVNTLHSVMGMKSYVQSMQRIIDARKRAVIDYHLMADDRITLDDNADRSSTDKLKIRHARLKDCMQLYPLQLSYEKEEVLLDPQRSNPTATLINLKNTIRRQIVLYATEGGKVVAKAGTNAWGIGYAQLGGVYTLPERRNEGIGELLIRRLLAILHKRGLHACLFAKKDNLAAVKLYEKTGFSINGEFRIAYYRK